jgi:hypothetical protein
MVAPITSAPSGARTRSTRTAAVDVRRVECSWLDRRLTGGWTGGMTPERELVAPGERGELELLAADAQRLDRVAAVEVVAW